MGALVGLGVGVGLLLVWSAFIAAAHARATPRERRGRLASCSREAGLGEVSVTGVRAALRRRCGAVAALRGPGRLADAAGGARVRR